MDRLPFELLNLIVYFIEADFSLPTRRSALASLSRTNKTFHNIATSKLYLHVVLTSEKRVGQWGKVYASKLSPWNLKSAKDEFRDLVVPASITFIPSDNESDDLVPSTEATAVFPRDRPHVDPLLAVSTPLTSFFFRNLTSLVVSPGFNLDHRFLTTLYNPTQPARSNLVHLDLSRTNLEKVVDFIFGPFNEFEFDLEVEDFDWEAYETQEAVRVAYWERYWDTDQEEGEEPECLWNRISLNSEEDRLISKAQIDFDCFSKLALFEWGPHKADYIRNHVPKLYPFSKLESFTLSDPTFRHVDLLFTSPTYLPSLTSLKLVGSSAGEDVNGEDEIDSFRILGWREAITHFDGTIVPPFDAASLSRFFDDNGQLQEIGPLSPGTWNHDKYTGVNLRLFDLSELRII
ncbi:hypothetical protein JCM5353_006222 [Sporobolomyces roseus]